MDIQHKFATDSPITRHRVSGGISETKDQSEKEVYGQEVGN